MIESISKYLTLNGVVFTESQAKLLSDYLEILLDVNKVMNLTAIREPDEAALKHIADSALCVKYLKKGALLDIGSGGGLPAFPVAILRPDITVTALDSTKKKTDFIADTAKKIGLSNLTSVCGRAEELAFTDMREKYDNVTARAVADMSVLSELAIPFVKKNGQFVALKGKTGLEEVEKAKKAIVTLGGKLVKADSIDLIGGEEPQSRVIAVISKIKETPSLYPRQYAKITKRPL